MLRVVGISLQTFISTLNCCLGNCGHLDLYTCIFNFFSKTQQCKWVFCNTWHLPGFLFRGNTIYWKESYHCIFLFLKCVHIFGWHIYICWVEILRFKGTRMDTYSYFQWETQRKTVCTEHYAGAATFKFMLFIQSFVILLEISQSHRM